MMLDGVDTPPLAPGPFTMRYGYAGGEFHCVLTTNGATYDVAALGTFARPRDFVALQFIDLEVRVESLAQVETTP